MNSQRQRHANTASVLLMVVVCFLTISAAAEDLKIKGKLPHAPITNCVADYLRAEPRIFKALVSNYPANPSLGDEGRGMGRSSSLFLEDFGLLSWDNNGMPDRAVGKSAFLQGELVAIQGWVDALSTGEDIVEGDRAILIHLRTFQKRSITRGIGGNQHQSGEYLNSILSVPYGMNCAKFNSTWQTIFLKATAAEIEQLIKANPSGVLVPEIREGMTRAEVEAVLGAPERKAIMADKTIYFYPKMKITFTGEKVSAIE